MSEAQREVALPAPPARVWEALCDAEQLSAWFGAEASIDAHPNGRVRVRWPDGTERLAVVEEAEAPRLLVFRWLPFERTGLGLTRPTPAGRVRITLEPHDGGTVLTVAESALSAGAVDPSRPGPPPGTTQLLERPRPAPGGLLILGKSP